MTPKFRPGEKHTAKRKSTGNQIIVKYELRYERVLRARIRHLGRGGSSGTKSVFRTIGTKTEHPIPEGLGSVLFTRQTKKLISIK